MKHKYGNPREARGEEIDVHYICSFPDENNHE